MASPVSLEPAELAFLLETTITQLGAMGPAGIDALVEQLATRPECPEFDAGVDLLAGWIGNPDV